MKLFLLDCCDFIKQPKWQEFCSITFLLDKPCIGFPHLYQMNFKPFSNQTAHTY